MNDVILGIIIGGIIAAVPTLIVNWMTLREQRRRLLMESAIQCTISEWKKAKDIVFRERDHGRVMTLVPMASYFIGMYALLKATEKKTCKEDIEKQVAEAIRMSHIIGDTMEKELPNKSREATE